MSCRSICQLTGSSQLCVARLNTRFPDSPRVASLQGMLIESAGELGKALTFYEGILAKDETNLVRATPVVRYETTSLSSVPTQTIVKRMVAVLKSMDKFDSRGGTGRAISVLVKYLDTYYGDAEAWQELAALYSEAYMCVRQCSCCG